MEESGGDSPKKQQGETAEASAQQTRRPRKGFISRLWRGIFGVRNEDYEKKLHRLSKEEAAVHSRMKMRAQSSRKRARNLIMLSVTFEVVAVAIAIIAVRSLDFTGPMKFFRTLPAILLPGLSYVVYSSLEIITRMFDRKDQKTLERLRAERKAKIDELKESTNYYTTQQLIQRYDLDPAAKIAAATALASRLGAESGLKVNIGDEPAKSSDTSKVHGSFEQAQSSALKQRNQPATREATVPKPSETPNDVGPNYQGDIGVSPASVIVEHYRGSSNSDGGWIARIAALLVAEDPSQCYALICGNCHKHNGLARKEDFPHITYYCPHCHALNTSSNKIGGWDSPLGSGIITPEASACSPASTIASSELNNNAHESIREH